MRVARASTMAAAAFACMSSAQAASFDCRKAASEMERLVCSDAALDARDAILAKVHAAARRNDADGRIARGQREWLARAQVCRTSDCLTDLYDRRIAELLRSSNGNEAAAHFYMETPAGLRGTLDVVGPVHGFAAVALSATFVGPGGVETGNVQRRQPRRHPRPARRQRPDHAGRLHRDVQAARYDPLEHRAERDLRSPARNRLRGPLRAMRRRLRRPASAVA